MACCTFLLLFGDKLHTLNAAIMSLHPTIMLSVSFTTSGIALFVRHHRKSSARNPLHMHGGTKLQSLFTKKALEVNCATLWGVLCGGVDRVSDLFLEVRLLI